VGLAYVVPGEGAVLACDGRITDDHSSIITDNERKYAICGSSAVLIAGRVGNFWLQVQRNTPKSYDAFRKKLSKQSEDDSELLDEIEWLTYDRKSGVLNLCDTLITHPFIGIGSGSSFGVGALEALPRARSLETASKALDAAMDIAIRRNAACGGEITMITLPTTGSIDIRKR